MLELIVLRLCLLRLFSPELHHQIYEPVNAKHKNGNKASISPPIRLLCKVQRAKIVCTCAVLTHLASRSVIGVQQMCGCPRFILVSFEVFGACFTGRWVEKRNFTGFALDWLVPHGKYHQAGHEIVEWINVIEPVVNLSVKTSSEHELLLGNKLPILPERLDLAVWNNHATERNKGHDDQWVDQRGKNSVGRVCCDRLSDGCVKKLVHDL